MAWIFLIVAGILEIGWAIGMKYSQGFTKPWPTAWTIGALLVSFTLLGLAVRTLPIGTAYAIWTGIGAAGTAVMGMILFKEPATAVRFGCLLLIVTGIVGLKLSAGSGK